MNNSNLPENFLESPILSEQSLEFDTDLHDFHAELASVFGDIGEPSLSVADNLSDASTAPETLYPSPSAQQQGMGLGFGGEADLNSFNAHLPNNTKINPNNFMEEPEGACWRIKTLDFGNGLIEVVATKKSQKSYLIWNKTQEKK